MTDFNKAMIEVIRRRRVALRYRQAEFAKKINMTPRGWRYVEHGQTALSVQRLSEVAIALEVPIAVMAEEAEFFIQTGRLPVSLFQPGDTCASTLDQLRRRNSSWGSAIASQLCEAHEG